MASKTPTPMPTPSSYIPGQDLDPAVRTPDFSLYKFAEMITSAKADSEGRHWHSCQVNFTASQDGYYKATLQERTQHSHRLSWEQSQWSISGTATRMDADGGTNEGSQNSFVMPKEVMTPLNPMTGDIDVGAHRDVNNRSSVQVCVFAAGQGDTIVLRPAWTVMAGQDISNYRIHFSCIIEFLGARSSGLTAPMAGHSP